MEVHAGQNALSNKYKIRFHYNKRRKEFLFGEIRNLGKEKEIAMRTLPVSSKHFQILKKIKTTSFKSVKRASMGLPPS